MASLSRADADTVASVRESLRRRMETFAAVRARPGGLSVLSVFNRKYFLYSGFCVGVQRAGRLTAQNGGFWPAQMCGDPAAFPPPIEHRALEAEVASRCA